MRPAGPKIRIGSFFYVFGSLEITAQRDMESEHSNTKAPHLFRAYPKPGIKIYTSSTIDCFIIILDSYFDSSILLNLTIEISATVEHLKVH